MGQILSVRIILGSMSDWEKANIVLGVLKKIGVPYNVDVASCHWNTGDGLEEFIREIKEELIVYIGGMQFAAPGIAETINKVSGQSYKIILAIPLDKVAKHACEDFPAGTAVFTAGFNSLDLKAGLINNALGIAKLYAWRYPDFRSPVQEYFDRLKTEKQLVADVELDEKGLIPDPKNLKGGK